MNKNDPGLIKNEFMDIYHSVCTLTGDEILNGPQDSFRPCFEKLQCLIARDVDDQAAGIMLSDCEFYEAVKHLSHLKRINGLRMEIAYARSITFESFRGTTFRFQLRRPGRLSWSAPMPARRTKFLPISQKRFQEEQKFLIESMKKAFAGLWMINPLPLFPLNLRNTPVSGQSRR